MSKEYYLRLRNEYLPETLKLIFILESPPISGKYFYDKTGNKAEPLFNEMMKAIGCEPIDKEDGLQFFKNKGYFLVDSTYKPVNNLNRKVRDNTILSDFSELLADLRSITPDKKSPIVLVKVNVCQLLEIRLISEGFIVLNKGNVVPFPSTGQQKRFQAAICKIL